MLFLLFFGAVYLPSIHGFFVNSVSCVLFSQFVYTMNKIALCSWYIYWSFRDQGSISIARFFASGRIAHTTMQSIKKLWYDERLWIGYGHLFTQRKSRIVQLKIFLWQMITVLIVNSQNNCLWFMTTKWQHSIEEFSTDENDVVRRRESIFWLTEKEKTKQLPPLTWPKAMT